MRLNQRNAQTFWYALYASTQVGYDEWGNQSTTFATYGKPVKTWGNISPAKGIAAEQMFGVDDEYSRLIVLEDRNTPIDEYAVLWVDTTPELDANGELKVNANGEIVTPWDYIVRRVARGLPNFGNTVIAIDRVSVTGVQTATVSA